jgi:hypothetical protein
MKSLAIDHNSPKKFQVDFIEISIFGVGQPTLFPSFRTRLLLDFGLKGAGYLKLSECRPDYRYLPFFMAFSGTIRGEFLNLCLLYSLAFFPHGSRSRASS